MIHGLRVAFLLSELDDHAKGICSATASRAARLDRLQPKRVCSCKAAQPPQISRSDCARPRWQNNMATELSPTTEPASMMLSPVLGHSRFKLLPGKQLQHLTENAGYSYHGGDSPPYTDYVSQSKP